MNIMELFPPNMFGIDPDKVKAAWEKEKMERRLLDYEVVNLDGERHLYRDAVSFMVGGDDEKDRTLWIFGNGNEDPEMVRAVYNEDEWRWIRPVEYVDDKTKIGDEEVNPLIDVSTSERNVTDVGPPEGDDFDEP